jgi:hypothetical protein
MLPLLAALVLVFDAQEKAPFTSVEGAGAPVAYTRRDAPGGWTQHWLYSPNNPQDRGILRTGRHAGDWELVQTHPTKGVVLSQHSGAERCPGSLGAVYVANGSHALYFVPGTRDRMFPDPNDEADGRGARVRAREISVTEDSPAWMRRRARWGGARAHFPYESDSPRGPAFQGMRWDDPDAFARSASPCRAARCDAKGECDGRETALGFAGVLMAAGIVVRRLARRRRRR